MNKVNVSNEVVINKNVTGEMGMETRLVNSEEKVSKKVSKKKKEVNEENISNKEQNKFFIDVSKDTESKEMILNLLTQANSKDYGREIFLKDLVLTSLPKLNSKDIEKIQEGSLTEMEKVERALDEHNKKTGTSLTLGEFLVKRLGIN